MSTFRWTPRRDRELAELRADGFKYWEIARIMGCSREEAIARTASLARPALAPRPDPARVPRPVVVARPGKIDLRRAPSEMERRAAEWAERGRK